MPPDLLDKITNFVFIAWAIVVTYLVILLIFVRLTLRWLKAQLALQLETYDFSKAPWYVKASDKLALPFKIALGTFGIHIE